MPIPISENIFNFDDQNLNPVPIDIFKKILADQSHLLIQSLTDHFTTQAYLLLRENNKNVNDLCKPEKVNIKVVKSLV
jgi:hypothetical protein